MKMLTKSIEVNAHDAPVIRCALAKRLKDVKQELAILITAQERDLMEVERWQLPANLQQMGRSQLIEQIHPWISLRDNLLYLIEQFTF